MTWGIKLEGCDGRTYEQCLAECDRCPCSAYGQLSTLSGLPNTIEYANGFAIPQNKHVGGVIAIQPSGGFIPKVSDDPAEGATCP